MSWTPADAQRLYHVDAWGAPYFFVNDDGHAAVRPVYGSDAAIDIQAVVQELERQGVAFPVVLRFQDLLQTRVIELNEAFRTAIADAGYQNRYNGVYPIKVNQLREVVEDILDAGAPYGFGLECGSKAELVATLPRLEDDATPLICNGYKDLPMLRLMLSFQRLGKNVLPVIEKYGEFEALLDEAEAMDVTPR
ncbi:MAG: biosynthetic arginine decarboxylase, partial [Bacteroidetes bacterium]|nr:biosynthetic arginine decarboxylase [Bacteroidota bacterium]